MGTLAPNINFPKALIRSQWYVRRAAWWLQERRGKVRVPEIRIRPCPEVRFLYSDHGDVIVTRPQEELTVEVKGRNIHFDSHKTFRFKTIITAEVGRWEKLDPKPAYIMLFNKPGTHFFGVSPNTEPTWGKIRLMDSRYEKLKWFYRCNISLCDCFEFTPPVGGDRFLEKLWPIRVNVKALAKKTS